MNFLIQSLCSLVCFYATTATTASLTDWTAYKLAYGKHYKDGKMKSLSE